MTTGERVLVTLFGLLAFVVIAAWISEPPTAGGAGAVATPTSIVQPDNAIERDLCGYVRSAGEAVDLAYVREASRDPRIRFALAIMASSYVQDGGAGAREQFLTSCARAGH